MEKTYELPINGFDASKLGLLKKLTSKSKATDKNIEHLSAKIKEAVLKKHEEK